MICFAGASAFGATVFQTGFEPAIYTIGQLKTQDGWGSTLVQSGTVQGGTQALGLSAAGLLPQISSRSIAYNATGNPDRIVTLSMDFFLESAAANNI